MGSTRLTTTKKLQHENRAAIPKAQAPHEAADEGRASADDQGSRDAHHRTARGERTIALALVAARFQEEGGMTTAELIRWHEDRARDHRLDYATIAAHRLTVAALRKLLELENTR